jgi:hypothetical protein
MVFWKITPCGLLDRLTKAGSFFFSLPPNLGLCCLTVEVSRSHKVTHTTGRTAMNELSPRRRGRYLYNTQQAQETTVHALSGIRTRDPTTRAAADLHLRLHGHRNRLSRNILPPYLWTSMVKKSAPEDLCSTLFKNAGFNRQACTMAQYNDTNLTSS